MEIEYDHDVELLSEDDFQKNWKPLGYSYEGTMDWGEVTVPTRIPGVEFENNIFDRAKKVPRVNKDDYPLSHKLISAIPYLYGYYGWGRHIEPSDVLLNSDTGDDIIVENEKFTQRLDPRSAADDPEMVERIHELLKYITPKNAKRFRVLDKKICLYPDVAEHWWDKEWAGTRRITSEEALSLALAGIRPDEFVYLVSVRFQSANQMAIYTPALREADLIGCDKSIKIIKGMGRVGAIYLARFIRWALDRGISPSRINAITEWFYTENDHDDDVRAASHWFEAARLQTIIGISLIELARTKPDPDDFLDAVINHLVPMHFGVCMQTEQVNLVHLAAYLGSTETITSFSASSHFSKVRLISAKTGIPADWVITMEGQIDKQYQELISSEEYAQAETTSTELLRIAAESVVDCYVQEGINTGSVDDIVAAHRSESVVP